MIIYDWPPILSARAERFHIDARSRSGGETTNGREQIVSSGVARWVATLTVPLYSPQTIRAMRALLARLDGRANGVRVRVCECANGNVLIPVIGGIPYSPTGAFHTPTGAGLSIGGNAPYVLTSAAAGSTQVEIFNGSTELPVLEGAHFGLGGYLYVIIGATPQPGESTLLDIRPRLRTAAAADDVIEWCSPTVPMRLSSDDSGAFELELSRTGTSVLDLVEIY
jgi:hypothetical protein